MASSVAGIEPIAAEVDVTEHELIVSLVDGRRIAVPLVWFPRLLHVSRGLVLGYPSVEYRKRA